MPGWLWFVCVYLMSGAPEGSIDSVSGEVGDQTYDLLFTKPVKFIHYTTAFSTIALEINRSIGI